MSISRRELLRRAGLLGAASIIPTFTACIKDPGLDDEGGSESEDESESESGGGSESESETGGGDGLPTYEWDGEPGPETIFSHGVASGDPLSDSVILWTRVSPALDDPEPVELFFEMALDPEFEVRVAADWIEATTAERDYTTKIDIEGLDPATSYYYRFYAQGRVSPIGRTRTAPAAFAEHLRFAFCSCASFGHGYFHAYAEMAGRADLDLVLHLGDYIYEFGDGAYGDLRSVDPPEEIVSLDDYRRRHRHYRSDPDLQEVHRQHPFAAIWDDHEIANDGWPGGAANHEPANEGPWEDRMAAAIQVYFEWLPLREGVMGRVYRQLAYSDLVHIFLLDTRYEGREEQILLSNPDLLTLINEPGRQLLGAEQEQWLFDGLLETTAQWKILAQQLMMGQFVFEAGMDGVPNKPLFSDMWDGYDDARRRIYAFIRDNAVEDVVVIAGDIHSSFANELTEDPMIGYDPDTGAGAVAVEFVTPGVTSPGISLDQGTVDALGLINPHWRWAEVLQKGYVTLDVKPERIQADWWLFGGAQVSIPDFTGSVLGASWLVESGTPRLIEAEGPAPEKPDPAPLAP